MKCLHLIGGWNCKICKWDQNAVILELVYRGDLLACAKRITGMLDLQPDFSIHAVTTWLQRGKERKLAGKVKVWWSWWCCEDIATMSLGGLSHSKTASKKKQVGGGEQLTLKFHVIGDSSPCWYLAKARGTSASRSFREIHDTIVNAVMADSPLWGLGRNKLKPRFKDVKVNAEVCSVASKSFLMRPWHK